ncbi:MAG: hypothetical protein EBR09_15975 [Proteobacteria bacterium]|nr:hypothetical protein [Pseudomonadota bacterium]
MRIGLPFLATLSLMSAAAFLPACRQRGYNQAALNSNRLEYSEDVNAFLSGIEKKTKAGFKFDWTRIQNAVALAESKVNGLPKNLTIEDQPLTALPAGIPADFKAAFEAVLNSQRNKGIKKIQRRIVLEQLIEQIAEAQNGPSGKSCSLGADGKNPRAAALNSFLKEFVIYKYGRPPEPLPDAFLTAVPFYGHLVEKESPFLDIAFAPNGSMAHKSAHSVNVHVMDFFELWLACEEKGSACSGLKLKDITVYIGLQGIAENLPAIKKDLEENRKIVTAKAGTDEAVKARKALEAGEADVIRANRMLTKQTVRTLDWSKTEFQNNTALWDVFFDFQNLTDEAFKNYKTLRSERGLKADDYLAVSMRTVANPFHMGKPEVLAALFPCSGWN